MLLQSTKLPLSPGLVGVYFLTCSSHAALFALWDRSADSKSSVS